MIISHRTIETENGERNPPKNPLSKLVAELFVFSGSYNGLILENVSEKGWVEKESESESLGSANTNIILPFLLICSIQNFL